MESPSIQSIQSNVSIDALCIGCSKIRSLEACLHCMQPICSECRDAHFEIWRSESVKFCDQINKKIERYLTKMSVLNPLMEQNKVNVVKVKEEIEDTFQTFIRKLTQQKDDLFTILDEIEKENKEFEIFESEIKTLKDRFEVLKEEFKDNSRQISAAEFDKFRASREEVHRVGVGYSGLKKKTFKIIGDYEKPSASDENDQNFNFFGNLIIADSEILKPQQQQSTNHHNNNHHQKDSNSKMNGTKSSNSNNNSRSNSLKSSSKHPQTSSQPPETSWMNNGALGLGNGEKDQQPHESAILNAAMSGKVAMFGTLRVKLKRIAEQMNELQPTPKKPVVEFDVPIMPRFIVCYHRHLYIGDDEGSLCVAELSSSLLIRSRLRLPLMSVKGLAVNKKYLAASFHDLTPQQVSTIRHQHGIKKFDVKSGVMLFKIETTSSKSSSSNSEVGLTFEKLISSSKSHTLIAPCGIAMSDSSLFVCDRELHAVFKIDIKSGNFVQKLITTDQEPVSIAIGDKYLVYTDGLKLELNLIDMDKFNILKTVKFSEELFYEPFDVAYKEGSYVFVKNKADTKLIVYDAHTMSIKYSFDYDSSNSQAISYIKINKEDYLLLGYANCVTSSFKLGLFTDI